MKTEKLTKKTTKKSTKKAAPIIDAGVLAKPVVAKQAAAVFETKPAEVKKTVTTPAAKPAVTTIEAKIDVGFGNRLFVRGQGAGLSWNQGTPLTCVDSQTWRWTGPVEEKLTFKFLLNDYIWAKGEDVVVTPGKRAEIVPTF